MSFLSQVELKSLGLKDFGERVKISSKASLYGVSNIAIGDDSRVDDFCVISAGDGGIEIGRHVHIAVFSSLIGKGRIFLSDFSNISSRVSIYSSSDDYSGLWMTNPTVPEVYTNVFHDGVLIGKHVIVGSGTVILPGVVVGDGVAVGALSLIKDDCESFFIYAGLPARKIGARKKDLLALEEKFYKDALDGRG